MHQDDRISRTAMSKCIAILADPLEIHEFPAHQVAEYVRCAGGAAAMLRRLIPDVPRGHRVEPPWSCIISR